MRKSVGARMAERAWEQISGHAQAGGAGLSELKARCQDFPRCVRQNGLSLAVTFFLGKQDDAYQTYLKWLATNLVSEGLVPREGQPERSLAQAALKATPVQYRMLTSSVMTAALWYKRLAEAAWTDA